jgi:ribosome-associated translation inhibitor RaiA
MLKREDIERFYKDIKGLDLKFPVAEIARQTGHSKANVSKYLSRKLEPSESFLNAFNDKFHKNGKNVSRETEEDMTTMTMKPTFGEKQNAHVTMEDLQKRIIQLEAEKKMLQEMIDKLLQKR